jgi:hypothetical protein
MGIGIQKQQSLVLNGFGLWSESEGVIAHSLNRYLTHLFLFKKQAPQDL